MMPASAPVLDPPRPALRTPGLPFALGFLFVATVAAALAGALPVEFSIATVFLFAGPHNWLEARYVLGRLPARAGKLRGFFLVSARRHRRPDRRLRRAAVAASTRRRRRLVGTRVRRCGTPRSCSGSRRWSGCGRGPNPRFDGGWVWPAACLLIAPACGSTRSR